MNHTEFLAWLDKEIGMAISFEYGDRAAAFAEVKRKFLTIVPTPDPYEPSKLITDGQ